MDKSRTPVEAKLSKNALVELAIGDIHENQNTDSLGRYAFSLKGFDPEESF